MTLCVIKTLTSRLFGFFEERESGESGESGTLPEVSLIM
jgi:hypothetical protein